MKNGDTQAVLNRAIELFDKEGVRTYEAVAFKLKEEGYRGYSGEIYSGARLSKMMISAHPERRKHYFNPDKAAARKKAKEWRTAAQAANQLTKKESPTTLVAENGNSVSTTMDGFFRKKAAEYILKSTHRDRNDLAEIILTDGA